MSRFRCALGPWLSLLFVDVVAVAAVCLAGPGATAQSHKVTEAPDTCSDAHAVLLASTTANPDDVWAEVRLVAASNEKRWQVVDDYQRGVVKLLSLRQYDTRYVPGGKAFVAHCGHGGTCNSLTRAFFNKRPRGFSPQVYCGPLPEGLVNEQRPR